MKKPRSDAVLDRLPPNQRAALDRWLFEENQSYDDAQKRLWQDFGVKVSRDALCSYYQRTKQRQLLALIATSSRQADEVHKTFNDNASAFYPPLLKLIEKLAFEKMLSGEAVDVKSVATLTDLLQADMAGKLKFQAEQRKERELQLRKEKLELDFQKYRDSVAQAKRNIESALQTGKAGAITRETIERIQEELKLI